MMALAYTIVAIMLVGGLLLAAAIVAVSYLGVSAVRPEYLRRERKGDPPPGP
jgi:hypothetical protein